MGSCSSVNTLVVVPKNISSTKTSINPSTTNSKFKKEKYCLNENATKVIYSKTRGIRAVPVLKPLDENCLFQNRMKNSRITLKMDRSGSISQARTGEPSFIN